MRHISARGFAAAFSLCALAACATEADLDTAFAEDDSCFQTTAVRFGTGSQLAERDVSVEEFGVTILNEPGIGNPGRALLIGDRTYPFVTLCARDESQTVSVSVAATYPDEVYYEDTLITRTIPAGSCARFPEGEGSRWWFQGDWILPYRLDDLTYVNFTIAPEREEIFEFGFWLDENYRVEPEPELWIWNIGPEQGTFISPGPECLADMGGVECYSIDFEDACANNRECMPHHNAAGLFDGCRPACDRMSETLCGVRDECSWDGASCVPTPAPPAPEPSVETEEPVDG